MSDTAFEIFDDARDVLARTRPIFVEKHDFSAKLFKNKETGEPSFSISSKGEHTLDIFKILGGVALFFLWVASMRIYFGIRRSRRKRKKELRRAAKNKKK